MIDIKLENNCFLDEQIKLPFQKYESLSTEVEESPSVPKPIFSRYFY
ncbi:hypothetical protein AM1_4883 [Acaryochloris marina MBIC11017]|uniref:Uncharacterized protein n=1 Tax=Acaryochloris marina (strain MBIC 11017) TaxID=329726 RepID=B0C3M0_ACAM1|nr:hypothetical protein AM1_4883 [Acaryochloris marina MBIC11017]